MASAAIKLVAPLRIVVLMKVQRMMLVVKKGKNSSRGTPKINPKTIPMDRIWTATPIVTQKGPIAERL